MPHCCYLPLRSIFKYQTSDDDVLVLIAFKAGLSDPQSKLASWTEDNLLPCNWAGVKCDNGTNRVSELNLEGFSLSGHIGQILIRLQQLKVLRLSRNNFSGAINPALAQIPALEVIDLSENSLSGWIPEELFRQCGSLKEISLARNNLSGMIPQSFNSSSVLETLNLSSNHLSGQLPSALWSVTFLQTLDISDNSLEGEILSGIGSLYNLGVINMSRNHFVGQLPEDIGNCSVYSLDFGGNHFSGGLPLSLRELGPSCKYLDVSGNFLTGQIPDWIGEMRSLEFLDLSDNNFSGRIPSTIGSLQFLNQMKLSNNQFVGNLPESLGNCFNLKLLDAGGNSFSGNLPSWVFNLALETISLSGNRYSGSISFPTFYLQTYQSLQVLDLSSNALTGRIPWAISNFRRLQALNLSRNLLVGSIPLSIGQLNTTSVLDISHNHLNGPIPVEIGNCLSLTTLILSRNNLNGSIPTSIAHLSNLELLDMSFNNLSGSLPNELTNLSLLVSFNISFNFLEGGIPVGGFFSAIPASSLKGNPSLCGSLIGQPCPAVHQKPLVLNPNSSIANRGPLSPILRHKQIVLSISSLVAIGAAIFIALGVVAISILNVHARASKVRTQAALALSVRDNFSPSHDSEASYGRLVMFSGETDFMGAGAHGLLGKDAELGRGGFGTVYRMEVQGKRTVAIKKLNTVSLVKSRDEFESEVKKLGAIRHRNLVSLEGYYWTQSLQLLINENVSGGSLHKLIHGPAGCLTWQQRFRIILGTARGLAHLHRTNVIHYNMKSANVLIDSHGEPKVGDFGLARLLPALDRYILSSKIRSALGYMAPEFACPTVKITEKCDVYGFGILMLEVVTGKRPVEYMEDDVVVLCDMVREGLDEGRVEECIDKNYPVEEAVPVVKLGLICSSHVPSNRPDMEEVTRILELIQSPNTTGSREELIE